MAGPVTHDELDAIVNPDADLDEYVTVAQSLADRSRTDESIRLFFSKPDILKAFIARLEKLPENRQDVELEYHTLRCLGNGCVSSATPVSRQEAVRTVVDHPLTWTKRYTRPLCDPKLSIAFAKVLYNLNTGADFTDNDGDQAINPAWRACYDAQLHVWLIEQLTERIRDWELETSDNDVGIDMLIDMLFWLSSSAKEDDKALGRNARDLILCRLVNTCNQLKEAEPLATLIEGVVALCRVRATQAKMSEDQSEGGLFELLETVERKITTFKSQDVQEDVALLLAQASSLTWIMSDLSAGTTFAQPPMNGLANSLVYRCYDKLSSMTDQTADQLLTASCLVLGNALLNMPEDDTNTIVEAGPWVDKLSSQILTPAASADLLHAAAGLLRNCCRPTYARDFLGTKDGVIAVVEKLCRTETPQIRESGIKLMKSLANGNPENQARLAALAQSVAASHAAHSSSTG